MDPSESSSPPLLLYQPGMDVGALQDWPWNNRPSSNYVLRSEPPPRASGRIDHATVSTRTGIWACTAGQFECTEQGDELMTVLDGLVEVTDMATGQTVRLGPGDSLQCWHGKRVLWNILQDVTKVFYGYKQDGYGED